MKITTVTCDRCKKPIGDDWYFTVTKGATTYEICAMCEDAFTTFIKEVPTVPVPTESLCRWCGLVGVVCGEVCDNYRQRHTIPVPTNDPRVWSQIPTATLKDIKSNLALAAGFIQAVEKEKVYHSGYWLKGAWVKSLWGLVSSIETVLGESNV